MEIAPQFSEATRKAEVVSAPESQSEISKDTGKASFEERSAAFLQTLDENRYGRGDEKQQKIVAAFEEFFQPYQKGEASLSDLLATDTTAGSALQVLRETYLVYKDKVDGRGWQGRGSSPEALPEFLSQEIVDSLEALDDLDWGSEAAMALEQRKLYNALFVVSEALDTGVGENRKKIEEWLARHVDDIGKLKTSFQYEEGSYDTSLCLSLVNIVARAEDENLARDILKTASEQVGERGEYAEEDFFENVEKPFLERVSIGNSRFIRRQEMIAGVSAEALGLDQSIVSQWREAKKQGYRGTDQEVYIPDYAGNLSAARNLERKHPGAAKMLYERFGVANFARYNQEMLLRQVEKADADTPYGIVVFPEADHNGAFFQKETQLAEIALKLRIGGLETRIIEAGSQRELARQLIALHKRYSPAGNKVAFAIVGGHGEPASVSLGTKGEYASPPPPLPEQEDFLAEMEKWKKHTLTSDKGSFTVEDITNGAGIERATEKFFDPEAPVVLISCSTGKEGGIAEKGSEKFGWNVSAPDEPTSIKHIGVVFDEAGKPKFDVEYYKGDAKQYQTGKLMTKDVIEGE